ncbi:hypothetical protein BT69DRAFT_1291666 [Atractiella rhizophila]|nr:hypothetical protein BT69DRAFT_1291666 [Atractiella rhizophila]
MKAMEWLERLLQADDHVLYVLQQRRRDMRVCGTSWQSLEEACTWIEEAFAPPRVQVQQGLTQYQELEAVIDDYGSKGQELEKKIPLDPSNPESQLVLQHISCALQVKSRFVALPDDYQNEPVLAQKLKDSFPRTIRTHLLGLTTVREVADTVAKLSEARAEARKEKEERLREKEEMFTLWKSGKMSFKPSTTQQPFQQPFTQNRPNPSFQQRPLATHRTIIEPRLSSPLIPTRIEHGAWRTYLLNERAAYSAAFKRFVDRGTAASPLNPFPLSPGTLPANSNDCNICGMEWGGRSHRCNAPPVPQIEKQFQWSCRVTCHGG